MGTEDLKARMKLLKFPSSDESSSFSPTSTPGGSLSSRPSRPRPSLGLALDQSSSFSRPPPPGSVNPNGPPLSRAGLKFPGAFPPQPSQDEYERKLGEIMKLTGVLNIDGKRYPTPIGDLEALGDLGNGTCGHVVKMRHKESGKIIACKQMRRTGNSEETKRIVMDMDVVLKSHDCREIVVCLGCFITASDVWICMELMATCFDKLLKQLKAPVPENICGKVAVATLNALNYLKDRHGVIHRDVKPSNILLDYEGRVKLCDFGISGRLVDSKAQTRSAGCAAYMAPERINPPNPNKPDYDIRADVWSLGITLVELATGQFPYKDCQTEFEVLTKVIQDDPPCLPQNKGFSLEFRRFVHDCLLKNHKDRPKYKKLLEHDFIIKYRDMDVDVGHWYYRVVNHSGDPNKAADPAAVTANLPPSRKTSLEQRHEAQQQQTTFKPQPSPRLVKSWRMQTAAGISASSPFTSAAEDYPRSTTTAPAAITKAGAENSGSFSRLNFYTPSSPTQTNSSNSGGGGGGGVTAHGDEQQTPYAYTRAGGTEHQHISHQYHHHLPSSRLTDYSGSHHHHQLADHMARLGEAKSPRDQLGSRPGGEPSSPRDHLSAKYGESPREHLSSSRLNDSSSPREPGGKSSRLNEAYSSSPRGGAGGTEATTAASSNLSPRYDKANLRLQELSSPRMTFESGTGSSSGGSGGTLRHYEPGRTTGGGGTATSSSYLDSSRLHLNGTGLNRSAGNYMPSYHNAGSSSSSSSAYHRSPPSTYSRSHHEVDYPSSLAAALKSPAAASKPVYDKYGSSSETSSPRDYSGHNHHRHNASGSGGQRKYSFEAFEAGSGQNSSSRVEYSTSMTPKGTRRYEALTASHDQPSPRRPMADSSSSSHRKGDVGPEQQQQQLWLDSSSSSYRSYVDRESTLPTSSYRSNREALGGRGGAAASGSGALVRKYPSLPVPLPTDSSSSAAASRGRDPVRDVTGTTSGGRSNFLASLKFSSWTLSSPLSMRRFRTSSSTDRASGFERSARHQPAYRSLNEKDKQFYSSSGKSDKL